MTINSKFQKIFHIGDDEYRFFGPIGTVISVSYSSNTKVRGQTQIFSVNGTISTNSRISSTVEESTDIWLRESDGSEKNIRFKGRLPVREGHTIYPISLSGKKIVSDPTQIGAFDPGRHVRYSMFNLDTKEYLFRQPGKIFTQTGETVGWVPRPDGFTWLILLFSIMFWGLGLIAIIYIFFKHHRNNSVEKECLELQKRFEEEHAKFLSELTAPSAATSSDGGRITS